MSREDVYLSFFKTNKINYIYHPKSQTIEFPCIHCESRAIMICESSKWNCPTCHHSGNIIALIEYAKHHKFGKIYIPKKEEQSIFQMLDRLSKKYPDERRLLTIKFKTVELIKYYQKNTV